MSLRSLHFCLAYDFYVTLVTIYVDDIMLTVGNLEILIEKKDFQRAFCDQRHEKANALLRIEVI